ncbi:MAG: S9 family peptidase [Nitratireductor sp.]|nr:S9 family peptidase [Nitratireductor sp.]MCC0020542.1 S9 family peptidase [Nitratireductor sp.]
MIIRFPAIAGAPVAEARRVEAEFHGVKLTDDYGWLRAENWQEAMREPEKLPEDIKAYLTAENAYYEEAMADTAQLQETLIAEMRGRIKEDDSSVPQNDGPFAYSWKYTEGAEHPVFLRTPRDGGEETVLLDVNREAEAHEYFNLGTADVSPGHKILAWSSDTSGSEYYHLRFRQAGSQEDTGEEIPDVGSVAWADDETIFYTRVDESHRPSKVFRHKLNTDPQDDVLVFEETDPRYFVGVGRTRSGKFIVIGTGMNDEDEVLVIPAEAPETSPRVIEPRAEGIEYSVEHQGDRFLIVTNADDAKDFKIVEAPVSAPGRENWKDVVPHKPGRTIVGLDAYRDWIIWLQRENALPRICYVHSAEGAKAAVQAIAFEEEAYSLGMSTSPEYETDMFRFSYSSPTTPSEVFDYDLASGERTLLKTQEVPSGHDPDAYATRRIMAPSHDGAEVPVTILYRRDTPLDGTAPCLLYGYGSYGMSMPASFSTNRLSLVDRGFVYAIAHVRGGEEKGRQWYEDAKFGKKPNTFKDFIAAAEKLIAEGFTSSGNIVIQGGSAGGLLVGAAVNMRPELFAGVIADVPFVDMLNTILDETLPLTPGEWSQWGNPIASVDAFNDIRSYSPYDNVAAKDYPAMLVTAGVSDPRVTYWEPAKWVAKLRSLKTDGNILMLRTNMTSGHFGKSGRFAALEDAARSFAFALKATGKI